MRIRTKRAFTLIELLVVVGIIALLMGILMPSISRAREAGKRTKCLANLRSVGQGIRGYMDDYFNYYPPMAIIPKDEEQQNPTDHREGMSKLLETYVGKQLEVFHCPSDRIMNTKNITVQPTADQKTWFAWQGSSYEPRTFLSIRGSNGYLQLSKEFRPLGLEDIQGAGGTNEEFEKLKLMFEDLTKLSLLWDYEDFHDPDGKVAPNSRMALYADFHAAEYK